MADAHRNLKITPKKWQAFMYEFEQTLDKFKVPVAEKAELKAMVQSTSGDIVVAEV
jgi:hemoglobin